jgi:hypothetical protein
LTPPVVLSLDASFLALDADLVLVLDPVAAFLTLDPVLGLDATFLALDPVPSLSWSLPFLGPFPFSVSSQIICFSICS